jgi:lipopolysaccharide biosynthesis glycosyltransferase
MRQIAVYAGTRAVYRNMVIAAKSLVKHTRMDRVFFLIEDDEFPMQLPNVITTVNESGQTWFRHDGPNYDSEWTYMSLMRLALPEVFPTEERVLWLDTDTIVEKDIGGLFDIDMDGNYVAAVAEPVRSSYPFVYHNSGVLLMDLDRIRRDGVHKKWIHLVNTMPYTAPDQDAINLFCQGEILTLPFEYNSAGHITREAADPYIRHHAGSLKWVEPEIFGYYERAEWEVKEDDS